MLTFVSSFAPTRVERQQICLESWLDHTDKVIGVQSPGETAILQPLFPDVIFIETDQVGDIFGRPKNVRTSAMIAMATAIPVLLINSDIEVRQSVQEFAFQWSVPAAKILKVGIRTDHHPQTKEERVFKWGIDAFLLTPPMVPLLPDIGMTMGCPGWDYWIPYQLHQYGYRVKTIKDPTLIHELHPRNWSSESHELANVLLESNYSVHRKEIVRHIQRVTHRQSTPNWKSEL